VQLSCQSAGISKIKKKQGIVREELLGRIPPDDPEGVHQSYDTP
jgi:hypothetical protein